MLEHLLPQLCRLTPHELDAVQVTFAALRRVLSGEDEQKVEA